MDIFTRFIVKKKWLIVIIAIALIVPSIIGFAATKINYSILSYLPKDLDSMVGETCLEDVFNLASTAMVTVDNMSTADIIALKKDIKAIDGVSHVIWADDLVSVTVPPEALPSQIKDFFFSGNTTIILVTFQENSSSELTTKAINSIEHILKKDCFISGISAIGNDIRNLINGETPIYLGVAVLLVLVVLFLGVESTVVPFIFLASLGLAILYNFGSNILLGEISYITKALAAVLQLGVTMDFSIFLLHRYNEERLKTEDHNEAMMSAIKFTATAIASSSLTAIAGFLALCIMTLTLGKDLGLVMAKGVLFGVICSLTVLPAMLLIFDKPVQKYKHRTVIPELKKTSFFVVKHYKSILIVFIVIVIPFSVFQSKTKVYYNLVSSMPASLSSIQGAKKINDTFKRPSTDYLLIDDSVSNNKIAEMAGNIERIDGVQNVLCMQTLLGDGIPEKLLPEAITGIFHAGGKRLLIISSAYKPASDPENEQVASIIKEAKKYDKNALFTGESPMSKDLIRIADTDFKNVNIASLIAIFAIILLTFRSVSIPLILVASIESAIMINMGIPFLTGTTIPFIASIVLGTIQLGATINYAILMTTRYREERRKGSDAKKSAQISIEKCSKPIMTSGLSFFGATIGVAMISDMDMIRSICLMIGTGALISMVVIILVVPAIMIIFSKIIEKTSYRFLEGKQ